MQVSRLSEDGLTRRFWRFRCVKEKGYPRAAMRVRLDLYYYAEHVRRSTDVRWPVVPAQGLPNLVDRKDCRYETPADVMQEALSYLTLTVSVNGQFRHFRPTEFKEC